MAELQCNYFLIILHVLIKGCSIYQQKEKGLDKGEESCIDRRHESQSKKKERGSEKNKNKIKEVAYNQIKWNNN